MCERARRSRDASSRYSIDTLFPGLSNNSAHARNTPAAAAEEGKEKEEESCVVVKQEEQVAVLAPPPPQVASMIEENNTNNGVASAEIGVGTDGERRKEDGGGAVATLAISPSSTSMLAIANSGGGGGKGSLSGAGRRRNQNNSGSNSGGCNGNNHRGRPSKRVNEGSDDRLGKEGKPSRSTAAPAAACASSSSGRAGRKEESVDNNGVCLSKPNSVGSKASSSSANGNSSNNGRASNSRAANNNRKRAASPLKPTTIQPKQMSLLSTSKMSRKTMFEAFQPWVLRTYGDSAKTKTITKKKYCRIVKTLRGEEINNAENSKFRFWVKAKGFHIGPPTGHPHVKDDLFPFTLNNNNGDEGGFGCYMDPELYVPTTVKDGSSVEKSIYKRVAVVEYFFDIIYTVHVETEAKNGKHAGQKRTYRAITEKYAFLPREAVTKFLLQCMECQKRGSPGGGAANHAAAAALIGGDSGGGGKVVAVDSSAPSPDSSGTSILTSHHLLLHESAISTMPLSTSPSSSAATIISGGGGTGSAAAPLLTTATPETSPLALTTAATTAAGATSSSSSSSASSCSSSANNSRAWRNASSRNSNSATLISAECQYNNNNTGKTGSCSPPPYDINFSLPFTTTYLRQQEQQQKQQLQQMRLRNGFKQDQDDDEDTHMSDANSEEDHEHHHRAKGARSKNNNESKAAAAADASAAGGTTPSDLSTGASDWLGYHPLGLKKEPPPNGSNNNVYSNGKHDFREQSSPIERGGANHEVVHDETSSNGNKEDEDDDDDDSEDKMDTQQYDPERLKAFNMFVRLFVDENLDRMVPISKQPKEKIQAIIDSCTRQFPEFAERARKRIRTYLKSCRRNKRSRDSAGWESSRPTPAHLTSVQAEQILAQACENESQNAKRMRMGLEPVSQPLPMPLQNEGRSSKENGIHNSAGDATPEKGSKSSPPAPPAAHALSSAVATIAAVAANTTSVSSSSPALSTDGMNNQNLNLSLNGGASSVTSSVDNILGQHPSAANKSMERSPLVDYSRTLNGNGVPNMSMYRPNFGQPFPRTAPFPSLFPPASAAAVAAAAAAAAVGGTSSFPHNVSPLPVTNGDAGPTDLSMKSKPLLTHKLNPSELATVRQLITGYRESAAFLLRSADELEQLLIQQQ